jgi:hypothetical protein
VEELAIGPGHMVQKIAQVFEHGVLAGVVRDSKMSSRRVYEKWRAYANEKGHPFRRP